MSAAGCGKLAALWSSLAVVPVLLALSLGVSSVAAWASAGRGEPACCCPKPSACKCHDHDREPRPPELKRCGGEVQQIAPAVIAAVVPVAPTPTFERRIDRGVSPRPMLPPADRTIEIEVPPF